ncbi:MAG TPA: response regulator transcription factor [Rhodopila sp.]|nr:response regulator transcription factor [Rhodopila sp.]
MKILLVDDHAVVRTGLRRLLGALPHTTILEAATGQEALATIRAETPALMVLDLNLPGLGGFELLQRTLAEQPDLRVLVLSMHGETLYATRALRAGAAGYLSKNVAPEELVDAVKRVMDGGRYVEAEMAQALALQTTESASLTDRLSGRDFEILRLLADGQSLSEIADALGVSYKTVANTCSLIKAKLGVTRTVDLIRLSLDLTGSPASPR